MSLTMIISKLIALSLIYLGYRICFKWKLDENEGSIDIITRWSSGIMFIFGGAMILLFNADIFNLPPG
jgi:hypothetical protein